MVSSVSSWLPAGERETDVRPRTPVPAPPGSPPSMAQPGPKASPGLEFVVVIGRPDVPEDDPLVIGGR